MFKKIRNWAKNSDSFEVMAIVAIIIGAIVMSLSFYLASQSNVDFKNEFEGISEYVGGLVGSLWSLAGVLLFYASLSSQKEDLERQRELLVRQIDEVVAQTKESRIQNEMFKEQKNEETFFQLLRFHSEIISTITIEQQEVDFVSGENINKTIQGRKTFVEYYDIYKRFFQEASELTSSQDEDSLSKIFDKAYNSFYLEYQADLGHYFRNLFNIIFFIESLKKSQQAFYLGLLMAQLSNYELTLLFFHCLRSTNKDFKILVEKYAILDQVPKDEVTSMAYKLYDSNAFGESGFGSGDIIDGEDMGSFDESSILSSEETDLVLSRFNLPNMDSSEPEMSDSSRDSSLGTMDDILNKLKKISSEKFPKMNEIDEIDNDVDYSLDKPLERLRENKTVKEDSVKKDEDSESEFILKDFFDDDTEGFDYDDDSDIIDLDKIEQIESKGLNNLLKEKLENNEVDLEQDVLIEDESEELNITSDFDNIWDDNELQEDEIDDDGVLNDESDDILNIRKSLESNLDDELSSLKKTVDNDKFDDGNEDIDFEDKYKNLKEKFDSDIDSEDMLFNKDADLINESKSDSDDDKDSDDLFDFSDKDYDDIENAKNKFEIDYQDDYDDIDLKKSNNKNDDELSFEDFYDEQDEDPKDEQDKDKVSSSVDKLNDNFDEINKNNIDYELPDKFDNLDDLEGDSDISNNDELSEINKEREDLDNNKKPKKVKFKVNKKSDDKQKGGSGFLSKLN